MATGQDFIETPKELDASGIKVDMAINVMYVNKCGFLHCIDRQIKFRSVIDLGRRKQMMDHTADELVRGIKKVVQLYNNAGITI